MLNFCARLNRKSLDPTGLTDGGCSTYRRVLDSDSTDFNFIIDNVTQVVLLLLQFTLYLDSVKYCSFLQYTFFFYGMSYLLSFVVLSD